MELGLSDTTSPVSPLENFVRDYVESVGGAWDVVELQVYDLLLPGDASTDLSDAAGRGIVRITFDSEALADHPGSVLASFGAPQIDRWLHDAMWRGRRAELHLVGLNLNPHDLSAKIRRTIALAPGLELSVDRCRPLDFPQGVFWFQATFQSDQKEQEIVPVAIDLHHLRQVRNLELLLDPSRLADRPSTSLIEARRSSVAAAYPIAQQRVLRTFTAIANARSRDLSERTQRQVTRMRQYYADLRSELIEQKTRATTRTETAPDELAKYDNRLAIIDREERLRVTELSQKSALRVHLKLLNVLVLHQPKLLVRATVTRRANGSSAGTGSPGARRTQAAATCPILPPAPLQIVWDPLVESFEAISCPACNRPGFSVGLTRQGTVGCADCAGKPAPAQHK